MSTKGISDAQVAKESLWAPDDSTDNADNPQSSTIQSIDSSNDQSIITISCSPEEAQEYHVGQQVSIVTDDTDDTSIPGIGS